MRYSKKKYETPLRPWDKARLEREREILKQFGLRRKKEIWRAESFLRKFRRLARELAAKRDKGREKELISKLAKMGLIQENSTLDDVLDLLQTLVFKKGFVNSVKQARQFIAHGNVMIDGRRVKYPSYIVARSEEDKIQMKSMPQKKTEMVSANG
jgi:small subunit ribosomal protein S4